MYVKLLSSSQEDIPVNNANVKMDLNIFFITIKLKMINNLYFELNLDLQINYLKELGII
jgi:hypothetical protein